MRSAEDGPPSRPATSWSVRERYGAGGVDEEEGIDRDPLDGTAAEGATAAPRRPRWMWAAGGLVLVLLLGTVLGVTSVLEGDEGAVSCGDGTFLNPIERRCVRPGEACTAWMEAPQRYTPVSCRFRSDGALGFRIVFRGEGSVIVALDKPDGENAYYKVWGGPRHAVDVNETVKGMRGPAGEWRLRVTFAEASGSARVTAYG